MAGLFAAANMPSLISAAGNILSGGIGSLFGYSANRQNIELARESRAWQEQENQKQRDFTKTMWELQNEYNTPANQRKLAQEAGYNPYILGDSYGVGQSGSPGSPSMSGSPDSARVSPVNPLSGIGSASDSAARFLELANQGEQIKSNIDQQKMQTLDTLSNIMLKMYKEGGQEQLDDFFKKFSPLIETVQFKGSWYEQKTKKELIRMDIENDRADLERSLLNLFGKDEYQKKLALMDKELSVKVAEINKLRSESRLNSKKVEELGSEMARNFSQASLFGAQASQITVLLPYIRSIMEDNSLMTDMDFQGRQAEFVGNESLRKYLKSDYNKTETKWRYSSEHNYVTDFLRGFTSSLPVSPIGLGSPSQVTRYYGREGMNLNSYLRFY